MHIRAELIKTQALLAVARVEVKILRAMLAYKIRKEQL